VNTAKGPRRPESAPARAPWNLAIFAALVLAVACLYWARIVFVPVTLAALLAFLLSPVVALARRLGLPRVPAVIVVVALALVVALSVGWGLLSQITAFANDLPRYRATIEKKVHDVQQARKGGALEKVQKTADNVLKQMEKESPAGPEKPVAVVVTPPSPLWKLPLVLEYLGTVALILVLLVFVLIDQRDLRLRVVRLFGPERIAVTTRLIDEAAARISRYLLMQSIINGSFGASIMVGLLLIGVPFALVLGCLAAALRFIPYVGAWAAASITIVLSLVVFDGWTRALLIVGLFAVTEFVVAFVLEPLLYGKSAGVSSLALLVATGFWTWLWGGIGLVLAVPLTVCVVVAARAVRGLEFVGILTSDEPPLPPHLAFYEALLSADREGVRDALVEPLTGKPLEAAFDDVVAPTLGQMRRDRDRALLTAEEFDRMVALVRERVDALAPEPEAPRAAGPARAADPLLVLGLPARDEADALGLDMLSRLLVPAGGRTEVARPEEADAALGALGDGEPPALVCIGCMGAGARRRTRQLVEACRVALPGVPILAVRWGEGNSPAVRADLAASGADDVATSVASARAAALHLIRTPVSRAEDEDAPADWTPTLAREATT
jgi:predicted PurR-regulated permease PerM